MNSPLNKLKETIARLRAGHNSRSPLYGRSAGSMLGLYLLCMAGVVLATFLIFLLGYNIYSALRDHATYYYYDFITPFIVLPLFSLMRGVRDMALLFVVLLLGSGWLGVTWAFFRLYQRDLTKVVQAAGTLMDPDAAPPELPSALAPAEAALRLARQQVQHSEALAREAEQRKNDLIVYLAHDLKTPLTSVIGYLTLLQDEPQISPELRARYTGIALDKAERLEDLINEREMHDIEAELQYKRRFPETFIEAFDMLMKRNGDTRETMAEKLNMPSRTLLRWLEDPDRRINADFVVTIALLWRLPDWISTLLLDRAYIHFSETNRRHLALQYILKVLWSEGVDKANKFLKERKLDRLTI